MRQTRGIGTSLGVALTGLPSARLVGL